MAGLIKIDHGNNYEPQRTSSKRFFVLLRRRKSRFLTHGLVSIFTPALFSTNALEEFPNSPGAPSFTHYYAKLLLSVLSRAVPVSLEAICFAFASIQALLFMLGFGKFLQETSLGYLCFGLCSVLVS